MSGTGIDGDIDGGSAGGGGVLPAAVPDTEWAGLVAEMDLTCRAHLGAVPVLYRPASGSPVPVVGIFDDSYLLAKGLVEAGVETRVPAVFLQLADLPTDPELDDPILTIGGADYRVHKRMPADFGSIVLALRKVV